MSWIAIITDSLSTLATTSGSAFLSTLATVATPIPTIDENPRLYWFESTCTHTPNGNTVVQVTLSGSSACWIQTFAYQVNADWNATGGLGLIANKPTTLAGYGITDAYPLSTNPAGFLTGITSLQVTTALGYTPYNSTNPASYITQAGARGAVNLTTTGTGAATYNSTTGTFNIPTPAAVSARSFSYPTRALNTCFQASATRDAAVSYSVDVTTTMTLAGTPRGSAALRIYTDSACTLGGQTVTSGTNGMPTTLSVTVGQSIVGSVPLVGWIPAAAYGRIETTIDSGTGTTVTFATRQGQEVLQ